MASLQKNVASQNVTFCLINVTSGIASTSTSTSIITAFVTKDGTQASAGGTFTSLGSGQWNYAPTQAETNATDVGIFVTGGSSVVPVNLDFHPDVVDASGFLKVDLEDVKGSAVSTSSAQIGVNVVAWNATTVASPATAGIPDINVKNYNNQTAATDSNNFPKVDIEAINQSTVGAQALNNSTNTICWGSVTSGTTVTVVVATLNNPSSLTDVGQLIGRTIIFQGSSTTPAMDAQASNITNSTTGATPTITFTALTRAPAAGDTFAVL